MSQQPLSVQIRILDCELDCELFERDANRVRLTVPGNVLLTEAKAIITKTESAVLSVQRAARGEVGMLQIRHCSAAIKHIVPTALSTLKAQFPALGVDLQEMGWADQAKLSRGDTNIGFMYRPLIDAHAFSLSTFMRTALSWLCAQIIGQLLLIASCRAPSPTNRLLRCPPNSMLVRGL